MKTNNKKVSQSRRQFLIKTSKAGLATAALKSSLVGSGMLWARNIFAQTSTAPKRFVAFHISNGSPADEWFPTMSGDEMVMNTSTQHYEPYKNHCVFFDELTGEGGHGAYTQCFTSDKPDSIDIHIGSKVGGTTPFSTAQLCSFSEGKVSSINGKGIPKEINPQVAFERYFGSGGATDIELVRRLGVLDRSLSTINSLRPRLNAVQAERLDLHADSIRKLEQRFSQAGGGACENTVFNGAISNTNEESLNDQRTDLHMELIRLIFQCDISRVASISFGPPSGAILVPEHGGWHNHVHNGSRSSTLPLARGWFDSKVAYLMQLLQTTPDVDGNSIFDNTLFYITSEMGNGSAHNNIRTPIMLAGGANVGIRGGQVLNFGGESYKGIFDTIMLAMGLDPSAADYPGYSDGHAPFSEALI